MMHTAEFSQRREARKFTPREQGVDRVARFVEKVFRPQEFATTEGVATFLETTTGEDFVALVGRYDGILNGRTIAERSHHPIAEKNNHVTRPNSYLHEIVFPPKEEKAELLKESYEAIREREVRTSEDQEVVARALSLATMFVHPLSDGNGRLGRLLYSIFSPNVERKTADDFTGSREGPDVVHKGMQEVRSGILRSMASDLGVSVPESYTGNDGASIELDWGARSLFTFETHGLGFIRAAKEIRKAGYAVEDYITTTPEGRLVITFSELPSDVQDPLFELEDSDYGKGQEERIEMVKAVVKCALEDSDFGSTFFDSVADTVNGQR